MAISPAGSCISTFTQHHRTDVCQQRARNFGGKRTVMTVGVVVPSLSTTAQMRVSRRAEFRMTKRISQLRYDCVFLNYGTNAYFLMEVRFWS